MAYSPNSATASKKAGIAAKALVTRQPARTQRSSLDDGFEHLQGQGGLGLEADVIGQTILTAAFGKGGVADPGLGQVEAAVEQGRAVSRRITEKDAGLAGRCLLLFYAFVRTLRLCKIRMPA